MQEECFRVADRHHRDKKRSSKGGKSSRKSSDSRTSDSLSKEERKPKKKAVEAVVMCKHCKKYKQKMQHPARFLVEQCRVKRRLVKL